MRWLYERGTDDQFYEEFKPGEMDIFKLEGAFFEVRRLNPEDEQEVMESIKYVLK